MDLHVSDIFSLIEAAKGTVNRFVLDAGKFIRKKR